MALEAQKRQEVIDLVLEHRYHDALERLPAKERAYILRTRNRIGQVLGESALDTTSQDIMALQIVDLLEKGKEKSAYDLLARAVNKVNNASGQKKSKGHKTPKAPTPYQRAFGFPAPHMTAETASVSDTRYEHLAQEIQSGKNPHFVRWLETFREKYQIPSVIKAHAFARKSITGYMHSAQDKIKARTGTPLTPEESDAYYHFDQSVNDAAERCSQFDASKRFPHFIEYIFVELLDALKEKVGIRRVLKTSLEEDIFRGCDLVVQGEKGHWFGIDITTALSEDVHAEKRYRSMQKGTADLPNTARYIQEKGLAPKGAPLEISMIIQKIGRRLMRQFAFDYLTAIGRGEKPNIANAFQTTLIRLQAEKTDPVESLRLNLTA